MKPPDLTPSIKCSFACPGEYGHRTSCLSEQQMKVSCRTTTSRENKQFGWKTSSWDSCSSCHVGWSRKALLALRHSYLTSKAKSLASLKCLLKAVKQRMSNY